MSRLNEDSKQTKGSALGAVRRRPRDILLETESSLFLVHIGEDQKKKKIFESKEK